MRKVLEKIKKIISFVLVLTMLLSSVTGMGVLAAENITTNSFESESDFDVFNSVMGTLELDMSLAKEGNSSAKIVPYQHANGTYQYMAKKTFGELQNNIVELWVYDDVSVDGTTSVNVYDSTAREDNKPVRAAVYIHKGNMDYYQVRTGGVQITSVPRTVGWHKLKWDYSDQSTVKLYIDGTLVLDMASSGYETIAIENYWQGTELAFNFDELSITEESVVVATTPVAPSNPVSDDIANTFAWTNVENIDEVSDYEYSVDAGASYIQCSSNPIVLEDLDYAVGQIMVRVRANGTDLLAGEAMANQLVFTKAIVALPTGNEAITFEALSDMDGFVTIKGEAAIDNTQSRSGISSMQLIPVKDAGNNSYQYATAKKFDTVQNKVVEIWVYDDVSSDTTAAVSVINSQETSIPGVAVYIHKDDMGFYKYRPGKGAGVSTSVPRTQGWHKLSWDYTDGTSAVLYIDGIQVYTMPSAGFDEVSVINYWQRSNGTLYVDDLTISDTLDNNLVVAAAPSMPLNDDVKDTFDWTYVPGNEDVSDYEISYDGGSTFTQCTVKPALVEDKDISVGSIMVRLKAEDAYSQPGQVLRNTEVFTKYLDNTYVELQEVITRANALYEKDYEAGQWAEFKAALTAAQAVVSGDADAKEKQEELIAKISVLLVNLKADTLYNFMDLATTPFDVTEGSIDWGEDNMSSIDGKGFRIVTEQVENTHRAAMSYSLTEKQNDKVVSLWFSDEKKDASTMKYCIGNDENAVVFVGQNKGSNQGYYHVYEISKGVITNDYDTRIRRLKDWHQLSFDFANHDGVGIYLDNRLLSTSTVIDGFDSFDVEYEHTGKASAIIIDEFRITEKNPVTNISLPDTDVILGYYDTYVISPARLAYEAFDASYPTTDRFSYSVSNEDILNVSNGGSVQAGNSYGTATATVTASSGVVGTVTVENANIKADSIVISDSAITDEPNIIDSLILEVGDIQTLNAIMTKGAKDRIAKWSSSDLSVAVVDTGLVVANGEGTTTITATTEDGSVSTTLQLTVLAKDSHQFGKELFVATYGDDMNGSGTEAQPFRTIERARDEIRSMTLPVGGVVVNIRGGRYTIIKGIEFDQRDSGTVESPIKYRAYNGEDVVFTGALEMSSDSFTKVNDASFVGGAKDKIRPEVINDMYVIDLEQFGINTYKQLQVYGHSAGVIINAAEEGDYKDYNFEKPYFSVMFDGKEITLARFPNDSKAKISQVLDSGAVPRFWNPDLIGNPVYVMPADRYPLDGFEIKSNDLSSRYPSWIGTKDIWMIGNWKNEFSDQTVPVKSVSSDGVIETEIPSAYGVLNGKKFFVYNLIQELDIPGEWYIDQENFDLYIIPPTAQDMAEEHLIQIPYLDEDMFTLNSVEYMTIEGIDMEFMNQSAVIINGGNDNIIKECNIKGTRKAAGSITNTTVNGQLEIAKNNGFLNCQFLQVNGGIKINAGDIYTLERGNNFIKGSKFEDFSTVTRSYNPAVSLYGVGNSVTYCEISDAPHNAIMFGGVDQTIEFTEFYDVVLEAGDQSAIYTGRNSLERGTIIRNNYFHDIGNQSTNVENSAIYLDDLASGTSIYDNVIENAHWGIFINGGRDNHVIGNTFVNLSAGLSITNWGYVGVNNWNVHGYGTYKNPISMALVDINWNGENSPYNKFENLKNIRLDDPQAGKYGKAIDNLSINVNTPIKVVDRGVGRDADALVRDWYYTKGSGNASNLVKHTLIVDENIAEAGMTRGAGVILDGELQTATAKPMAGYAFVNWSLNGQEVSGERSITFNVTGDATLKANYKKLEATSFTTTFSIDGVKKEVITKIGETIIMPEEPTKEGSIFNGWYSLVENGVEVTDFETEQVVYAQWKVVLGSATITSEATTVAIGEVFVLPIMVKDVEDLGRLKAIISYDESYLTIEDVTFTEAFTLNAYNVSNPGEILFDAVNAEGITSDEKVIAQIRFKVSDAATNDMVLKVGYDVVEANKSNDEVYVLEGIESTITVAMSGDMNKDGVINGLDALMVLRYLANSQTLSVGQLKAADYDEDGVITSSDALKMLRTSVGI